VQLGPVPSTQVLQEVNKLCTPLAVCQAEAHLGIREVDGSEAVALAILASRGNTVLSARQLPVVAQDGLQVEVTFVQEDQLLPGMATSGTGRSQAVNRPFFWA
jgi:hypothetical protein